MKKCECCGKFVVVENLDTLTLFKGLNLCRKCLLADGADDDLDLGIRKQGQLSKYIELFGDS